jgi:2-oxoglutarate ferredoxin oxidoreductase subunit alpha
MFMRAAEALVEASLRAGCKLFCAYPITPVEDMMEFWLKRAPDFDGALSFVTESEIEGGAYLYGFAAAGKRCAFASTGTGFNLIAESLGMIMGAQLPVVLFNFPRAGGLSISQADYHMCTRALSHGDNRAFVLAPMGTQEAVDLTMEAFYIADKYRNPVVIMGDYTLGLTMEVVEFGEVDESDLPPKDWALTGDRNREARRDLAVRASGGITAQAKASGVDESIGVISGPERAVLNMFDKYASFPARHEAVEMEDAEIAVVAYGTMARMVLPSLKKLRAEGIKVGMIRPITLYPFPNDALRQAASKVRVIDVMECSAGQMVDDVRIAVGDATRVELYARPGGASPSPQEIEAEIRRIHSLVEVPA